MVMIWLLKCAFLGLFAFAGYLLGVTYGYEIYGIILAILLGIFTVYSDLIFEKVDFGTIAGGILGLSLGLLFASLILVPISFLISENTLAVSFALKGMFGYGGLIIGLRRGRGFTLQGLFRLVRGNTYEDNLKILDTSVIIDGRIADVCETGFIEGTFVLPQFILQELQYIADSQDSIKRTRGRRGLDVLHRIQKMSNITVQIVEQDFPKIKEVDSKLVALAKIMNAKIITNDFNLNKVAQLQGVSVLNLNELANSVKPVVLPGETMKIYVLKEGKEYNQGVAYLDDGTMVVIENGRKLIGKTIEVAVTSVLQTTAGRMIFSKAKEEFEREESRISRG
ncbi:MAG: PIN domain-containing protein [Nitrospiraceae bacterium]|nr:MAG: PIN domain-containing protein [Nitrospiraceae bacterium]